VTKLQLKITNSKWQKRRLMEKWTSLGKRSTSWSRRIRFLRVLTEDELKRIKSDNSLSLSIKMAIVDN